MRIEDIHTENSTLMALNPGLAASLGKVNTKRPSKFKNVIHLDPDGEKYDSGIEADHAKKFSQGVMAGEYILYIHHVTFPLPGGVKIIVDHFLLRLDKENSKTIIEIYDSKGYDVHTGKYRFTQDWRNKQKQFEAIYGLKIQKL